MNREFPESRLKVRPPFPASGLYAVSRSDYADADALAAAVAAAIRGGARVIQYRARTADPAEAERLLAVCRTAGVPFLINDAVELARRLVADGVHLGKSDLNPGEARQILGAGAVIGVSCYDSLERAVRAEAEGADYVAFGRFFPSRTKPAAPPARIETLAAAKRRLHVPVVAIGGITAANGGLLLEAGADLLAVIGGVFGGDDPEFAARAFAPLFSGVP